MMRMMDPTGMSSSQVQTVHFPSFLFAPLSKTLRASAPFLDSLILPPVPLCPTTAAASTPRTEPNNALAKTSVTQLTRKKKETNEK